MSRPAVLGIAGYKNAGKTTLAERLIGELTKRGLSVSTVKRAHHRVDVDQPGRDSYRHREAGASEVALVTASRFAIMHELRGAPEPTLDEIVARLAPVDLVIVEGFKAVAFPKIEIRRAGHEGPALGGAAADVIAIASDRAIEGAAVPVLALDDVAAITDFIIERFALETGDARTGG